MGGLNYVDRIEAALGIAEAGKTRIAFEPMDLGCAMGVAFTFPSGRRHAVRVLFEPGWDELVIEAMKDWLSGHQEALCG
jgi:hypothetical protein